MSNEKQVRSLHRYFLWANRMKHHCIDSIQSQGPPPTDFPELQAWLSGPFAYGCYWLATLFVVVEGLNKIQMTNAGVSTLLAESDKVNRLRRFRNCVNHYQEDYLR